MLVLTAIDLEIMKNRKRKQSRFLISRVPNKKIILSKLCALCYLPFKIDWVAGLSPAFVWSVDVNFSC